MLNQPNLAAAKLTGLIDRLNDRLTSYRLMLYFLLALAGWAVIGGFFNKVPYSWHSIIFSAVWLAAVCWPANKLIAWLLDIPANKESGLITALILCLILTPAADARGLALNAAAGLAAIASKYVLTLYRSHLFNPAAFGAFISGTLFHNYAAWWVGTEFMTPIVVLGGIFILRKMKRFTMAIVFLAVYVLYLIYGSSQGGSLHFLWLEIISTPAIFLAVVMLPEPLTSPAALEKYLPYAVIVGVFYSFTKLKITPGEALLIGNLFTFAVAANRRYEMKFTGRSRAAEGIYSFAFTRPAGLKFSAGQYLEWTAANRRTDSRGNRRYLTISSSPTEHEIAFTVKVPAKASAFKQQLAGLKPGDKLLAGHLAGNFRLPGDAGQKLAFLAGGIGITPFRSMVKYMVDSGRQRDAVLLYSANSEAEFSFRDLFERAAAVGLKTSFLAGQHLDETRVKALVPDYKQRLFYVSGPYGFVQSMNEILLKAGVPAGRIVTDYFPGYGG